MAFDVGAGLSTMGEAVSKYAGVAALEQQKSALEEQKIKLADQMAGTRQEKQNQFELTRDEAKLQEEYRLKRQAISEDIDTAKKLGLIGGENAAATPPISGARAASGNASDYESAVKNHETAPGNRMVFNQKGSGAFGPYQFMPESWASTRTSHPDLNLPADMTKATEEQHDVAFRAFTGDNAAALKTKGIPVSPVTLDLAHRVGAEGTATLLSQPVSKPLSDIFPAKWLEQNPDMQGKTAGDYIQAASAKMKGVGDSSTPAATTGTPPMPPPIDPYRRTGLSLLPTLKPYGEAMTAADKAANEDAWKRFNAARDDEKTAVQWKQNDLLPDGSPNLAKIAFNTAKTLDEEKNKARGHLEGILPPGAENMTPEELRKTLNPLLVRQADQLNAGTNFLSTMGQRPMGSSGPSRGELAAITEMLHPSFSADRNEQIRIFKQDYMAPGKPGNDQVQALSNAGQHTAELVDAYNAIHNSKLPVWNKWYQDLAAQKGWGAGVGFDAVKQAVATELAKVVANAKGAGAVSERDENQNILARWNSPEQMSEVIGNLSHLYSARRNTLVGQAKRVGLDKDYINEAIGQDGVSALDSLPGLVNKNTTPARPTAASNLPPPPDGFKLIPP